MRARLMVSIDDIRRDAGYAVRLLRRNPIIAATAVLSLAIGIGANAAIFTVANALLLRAPAGVTEPDRLVDIGVGRGDGGFNPGSYPTYLDLRARTTTLDGVYAHQMFAHTLSLQTGPTTGAERTFGQFVTLNYFDSLGARPAAGRLFGAGDDERRGASPLVVLSHRFWMRRFNGDPSIVGRELRLNGQSFSVAGVTSEGFQGTGLVASDMWLPLNMIGSVYPEGDAIFTGRANGWLVMGGRLKPGVAIATAAAEVGAIGQALIREHQESARTGGLRLLPSSSLPGNRGPIAAFVVLLTALVLVVLLVACANLSCVLLARAAARRREMAVRLAIGAGRSRIVRQLLTETLILFVLGGAAGLTLARVLTMLVVSGLPSLPFPVSLSLALDGRAIAFTAGLSLARG